MVFVAVLIGITYLLDYAESFYPAMRYYHRILVLMGINITLAVSLNIINGHAGQFSLGHAGFMAIGAYFAAFLTVYYLAPYVEKFPEGSTAHWVLQNAMLVLAVLLGGAFAALSGYVVGLPSLRLRGDYLAIVTLGFGEIIRVLILNIDKIGAARGFSGIPAWSNFFWVFFFAGLTILVSNRLINSSVGRAFLAVREDQIAAEAMGVDTTRYKVKAFIIGSCLRRNRRRPVRALHAGVSQSDDVHVHPLLRSRGHGRSRRAGLDLRLDRRRDHPHVPSRRSAKREGLHARRPRPAHGHLLADADHR